MKRIFAIQKWPCNLLVHTAPLDVLLFYNSLFISVQQLLYVYAMTRINCNISDTMGVQAELTMSTYPS